MVVSGLSTTVFFIVAVACFARCNPRFERWGSRSARIGPLLRDHRALEGCTVSPEEVALIPASLAKPVRAPPLCRSRLSPARPARHLSSEPAPAQRALAVRHSVRCRASRYER